MQAVIEMSMGTRYKYEICKHTGALLLDRPIASRVPYNYGFIPDTLCEDGDAIDVFVASAEPIPGLTRVEIEVVGLLKCVDNGVSDDKVLAYVRGDKVGREVVPEPTLIGEVRAYLQTYKKNFEILELLGGEKAARVIKKARRDYGLRKDL